MIRSETAGLVLLACLAGAGTAGGAGPVAPTYLLCASDASAGAGDPVMFDPAGARIVWAERVGEGEWRRTTYERVAATPAEVSARAERAGEGLHLTLNVLDWTYEREWPRPRGENASVLDAHNERLGFGEGVQLYLRERGVCRVVP